MSLLMTSVNRVNPVKLAIAESKSKIVTCSSVLGCSIGTPVTRVTRVAQSKSARESCGNVSCYLCLSSFRAGDCSVSVQCEEELQEQFGLYDGGPFWRFDVSTS